jgi:glutathione S-transferase
VSRPALVFYFAPGSSSMAVHIALHEIGAPFEPRPLSFAKKEQREAGFLAVNPEGKVPTLLIDGKPLTEVAAILFYLAKKFPEAGLLPDGSLEGDAKALSWMSYIASTLHPARQKGLEHALRVYETTEMKLGGTEWVLDDYSVVDIHLFRLFWRIRGALVDAGANFPKLEAHYERMMARPAVRKTIAIESEIGYELP